MPKPSQKQRDADNRQLGSLVLSILLAVFWCVVGLFAGIVQLASTSVSPDIGIPAEDERKPRTIYFPKANDRGTSQYESQLGKLIADGPATIKLSSAQLNAWAKGGRRPSKPTGEGAEAAPSMDALLPSFRIIDDKLAIFLYLEFNIQGEIYKTSFHTIGRFSSESGRANFVPEVTYLGSALLPPVLVAPLIEDTLLKGYGQSEYFGEVLKAWSSVKSARIENDVLVLTKG